MLTSLLAEVGGVSGLLTGVSLMALVGSGVIFVAAGIRAGQEALIRRADLVLSGLPASHRKSSKQGVKEPLFSRPESVADGPEQRAIVRNFSGIGIPPALASWFFAGSRFIIAVALGMAAIVAIGHIPSLANSVLISAALAVCAAAGGWKLPLLLIRVDIRRRASAAANGLPEALDLMVVCIDAGLSLEDALGRVVKELGRAQPELAQELALTSADLQILPSRDEALQKMADRMDLPSIRAFVATLIQTLRYGTPLAQALRTIASELRSDSLIKLEEQANKLPALLTVPMMVLIMPTIFLIIGGPAILRLIDVWR